MKVTPDALDAASAAHKRFHAGDTDWETAHAEIRVALQADEQQAADLLNLDETPREFYDSLAVPPASPHSPNHDPQAIITSDPPGADLMPPLSSLVWASPTCTDEDRYRHLDRAGQAPLSAATLDRFHATLNRLRARSLPVSAPMAIGGPGDRVYRDFHDERISRDRALARLRALVGDGLTDLTLASVLEADVPPSEQWSPPVPHVWNFPAVHPS